MVLRISQHFKNLVVLLMTLAVCISTQLCTELYSNQPRQAHNVYTGVTDLTTTVKKITILGGSKDVATPNTIYGIQINDGDIIPYQNSGTCDAVTLFASTASQKPPNPLYLSTGDKVTEIKFWMSTDGYKSAMNKLQIVIKKSSGSLVTHNYVSKDFSNGYSNSSGYTVPSGQQFVGFQGGGSQSSLNCGVFRTFGVVTRSTTAIPNASTCTGMPKLAITNINLSRFDGGSIQINTGSQQKHTVNCTLNTGESCASATYSITVSGPNTSLVTLSGNTLTFAKSFALSDAAVYSVSVVAQMATSTQSTAWSSAFVGTFSYVTSLPSLPTSLTFIQGADSTALKAQTWQISSTTPFTYQIKTVQSPNALTITAYSVTATSSDNPTYASQFQNVNSTGYFVSGPFFDCSAAGTYTIQINSVTLAGTNYSSGIVNSAAYPNSFTFKVVDPCYTAVLTAPSQSDIVIYVYDSSATYYLNNFTYSTTNGETQICGNPTTQNYFQMTTGTVWPNQFIYDASSNSIQLQASQISNYGVFLCKITGTLSAYANSVVTVNYQFNVVVLIHCYTTTITGPSSIMNFEQFAGYNTSSDITYQFNDTISQSLTLSTDSQDFCGKKTIIFMVDNQLTTSLSINSSNYIIFSPSSQATPGTKNAIVVVCMADYPTICSNISFNVTTLVVTPPTISNQTYSMAATSLTVKYGLFSITPVSYMQQLSNSVQAYLLEPGATLSTQFEPNSQSIVSLESQSWITLNQAQNSFYIYSSNNQLAGDYIVILVAKYFGNFDGVYSYTKFTVSLLKTLLSVDLTPLTSSVSVQYLIGTANSCISLLNYYNITQNSNQYKIQMNQTQISGPSIKQTVIDSLFCFSIQADDNTLDGQQAIFGITITTNLLQQVPNSKLQIVFYFKLSSENKQTAKVSTTSDSYQLNNSSLAAASTVSIQAKSDYLFQGFQPKQQKGSRKSSFNLLPAQITSVDSLGKVTISFYQYIYVPKFTNPSHDKREFRLLQGAFNLTLQQFIDTNALKVQLQTSGGLQDVNWTTISLSNHTLQLQLNFKNALDVSSKSVDVLVINFLQPELFQLNSGEGQLFTSSQYTTVTKNVPPQFASQSDAALFNSIAIQSNTVGLTTIVATILLQIVAKKIISSMYLFFVTLQIILLVNLHSTIVLPASVQLIMKTISDIINLSSFDKTIVTSKLKLPSFISDEKSVFMKLGLVALSIGLILVIALLVVIFIKIIKNPRVKQILLKIKNFLFWNFLIRYFQVAYLDFNFSSIKIISDPNIQLTQKIPPINILVIQSAIVLFIIHFLASRPLQYFQNKEITKHTDNLYSKLDTRYRSKIFYGAVYFILRISIILAIVLLRNYSVQWGAILFAIMFWNIYLFAVSPYLQFRDGELDYFNAVVLLFTQMFSICVSSYTSDNQQKYLNGYYFDSWLGFAFLFNIFYIILLPIEQGLYKLKLKYKRNQQRKVQKQKQKEFFDKEQKEIALNQARAEIRISNEIEIYKAKQKQIFLEQQRQQRSLLQNFSEIKEESGSELENDQKFRKKYADQSSIRPNQRNDYFEEQKVEHKNSQPQKSFQNHYKNVQLDPHKLPAQYRLQLHISSQANQIAQSQVTYKQTDLQIVQPDKSGKKHYDECGDEVDLDALREKYFSNLTLPGDEGPVYINQSQRQIQQQDQSDLAIQIPRVNSIEIVQNAIKEEYQRFHAQELATQNYLYSLLISHEQSGQPVKHGTILVVQQRDQTPMQKLSRFTCWHLKLPLLIRAELQDQIKDMWYQYEQKRNDQYLRSNWDICDRLKRIKHI